MIEGTIRSSECSLIIHHPETQICSSCTNLVKDESFQKRVKRSIKDNKQEKFDNKSCKNSRFLKENHKVQKILHYRRKYDLQRLKIHTLSKRLARLHASKKTLLSKFTESVNRGNVSAIIYDLNLAHKKGLLEGKSKVLGFIANIIRNFRRKSPRYNKFTKQIYTCLRIIGGPRAARVLAKNLDGPSDDTQRQTQRKHLFSYHPENISDRVFSHLASVYASIKEQKKINGDVLVETAEDETAIIAKVEWDARRNEGWGWCGQSKNHDCRENFVHVVDDKEDAYERLVEAFQQNTIAGHARVILINPIHPELPPLVALLQAVCNKFDHHMVRRQWDEIQVLYDRHLLPVLGPLVGHASDGDSRRRKLHMEDATSKEGDRFGIQHENFTMSGSIALKNGKKVIEGLSDQDFIHNSKKLVNHLLHPSRILNLGGNLCHGNHLQLLIDNANLTKFDHGLQQSDVDRRDRMNWESAQRLLFPKIRDCLARIDSGAIQPQENVVGTRLYLYMVWKYVEIFYSLEATLTQRIENASYVCNFLRIWRLWVFREKNLSLKENFLSRETFLDVSLSCHHVAIFIQASRDFAPRHPVHFQRLGSDVCEEFFSANGSFTINKHNYTITDMFRNVSNMQHLQTIFADSQGPENQRKHRKGENIWKKGHNQPTEIPNLQDFPSDAELTRAWETGLSKCKDDLRTVGIVPDNENHEDPSNSWFFAPHSMSATTKKRLHEAMWAGNEFMTEDAEAEADSLDQSIPIAETVSFEPESYVEEYPDLALHLRHVVNEIDEDEEEEVGEKSQTKSKLTVNVPEVGEVHKSTIFTMLNNSPDGLSKDRLRRVRSKHVGLHVSQSVSIANEVGLFDDVAVHSKVDRAHGIKIGRVIRMRNLGRGAIEFKRPVALDSQSKYPELKLIIKPYHKDGDCYQYNTSVPNYETVSFTSVVMKVTMTVKDCKNEYTLNEDDKAALAEFERNVSAKKNQRRQNVRNSRASHERHTKSIESSEGRVVITTESVKDSDNPDCRRSHRVRRMVLYEAE